MIIAQGADFIRVRVGRRSATLRGETRPEGPSGPDFVVFLDGIEHWDAPHEAEPLTLEDIGRITQAAESGSESLGLTIEFE